jgi:hypothetical protein
MLWWKTSSKLTLWQFFKKENPQILLMAERYLKQKSVTKVVRNTATEIGRKYTRNLHYTAQSEKLKIVSNFQKRGQDFEQ